MYQKLLLSVAALALLASCSVKEDRMKCVAPVTVRLSGFSVSQEDFPDTRAAVPNSPVLFIVPMPQRVRFN